MGTSVFPSLPGLMFPVTRSPVWDTTVQQAISGKETRIARQSYPRWKWDVSFSLLRSAASYGELQELLGFFNTLQGQFDSFLYTDADDNNVTGQQIGHSSSSQSSYQLVRSFGAFTEPVLAPNTVTNVYFNGVAQTPGSVWNYTTWGGTLGIGGGASNAAPGILSIASPPAGLLITVDMSYYWPCRMQSDSIDASMFLTQMYEMKKFSFISVKN